VVSDACFLFRRGTVELSVYRRSARRPNDSMPASRMSSPRSESATAVDCWLMWASPWALDPLSGDGIDELRTRLIPR
jgi:hypothetical protein